ncbi:T9SS type B sorting domain-containing protein [Mucilaginibacter terrigena]|uniref:T9SS type B sorting domain-containing protein n=1 Tax=Mucilaginibacter terrigena TaxID=2492395 RepID=A0A4Q5LKU9_9SPHI|nr:gliding motility-associated C-terminal domain-containing protein [Mucilaginibacter terrigena]RYU89339.1 T9SS type B sorting domain-containing protein [Mucilaginibacter terrigena]
MLIRCRALLMLLLLCNGLGFYAYGQKPVITPKPIPVLPLDGSGKYTVLKDDIATYQNNTDSPLVVSTVPTRLTCDNLGNQTIKVKALTNGSAVGPPVFNVAFPYFSGAVYDYYGNLYYLHAKFVKKLSPDGYVSIIAGTGVLGSQDGPGATARFADLHGIAIDANNNIYVADAGRNTIKKITPDGFVSNYAGTGAAGNVNGPRATAAFNTPKNLAINSEGDLFINDYENRQIRKITPDGIVSIVCTTDGPCVSFAFGPDGYLYWVNRISSVGGTDGHAIYRIKPGVTESELYAGSEIYGDVLGNRLDARFGETFCIAFGTDGSLFVNDSFVMKRISPDGVVSRFYDYAAPQFIVDPCGNLIYFDYEYLRKLTLSKQYSLIAGGPFGAQTGYIQASTCQMSEATIPVYIQSKPTITSILPPVVVSGCATLADYTIRLTATDNCPSPTITYSQSPAAGTPFTDNSPVLVTITATDSYGGTDVQSFTVTNTSVGASAPTVSVTAQNSQVCEGEPARFHAEVTGADAGTTYQWQVNGLNTGTDSPDFVSSGLKSNDIVTCVVTTGGGCGVPVLGQPVQMVVSPKPVIALNPTEQILAGNSITLNPLVPGNIVAYKWLPAAGLSDANSQYPVANPDVTTTYTLTATSDMGCEADASVKITVVHNIAVPNAFTPNGDGSNDQWAIKYLDSYPRCAVNVYSRNGGLVFQSNGYGKAWNGSSGGKPLPAGVYYYIIDLKDGSHPLNGSVTILR